ncbi:MAG: SPFH/Band 7/PHB domain protein [Candidatus Obscuribacterales bacterium]|nr:SPFH/Band 7/PHB domain protein [Candidatus Obscuribacterales bacterium]
MFEILGGMVVLLIMVLISGLKTVKEHTQLVVFRNGRLAGCKGPGVHLILPIIENVELVDTRITSRETPPVEALTRDGTGLILKGQYFYQVADARKAVTRVENIESAVRFSAESALREMARNFSEEEMKVDGRRVNSRFKSLLEKQTDAWGIRITHCELTHLGTLETNLLPDTFPEKPPEFAVSNLAIPESALAELALPGYSASGYSPIDFGGSQKQEQSNQTDPTNQASPNSLNGGWQFSDVSLEIKSGMPKGYETFVEADAEAIVEVIEIRAEEAIEKKAEEAMQKTIEEAIEAANEEATEQVTEKAINAQEIAAAEPTGYETAQTSHEAIAIGVEMP